MKPCCYCCNALATTTEHVPPQCLFPEKKDLAPGLDFRKNLITVPACAKHNLKKSGDDEYLMYILAMNLPAEAIALHHFKTKIWRAIDRRPALANQMIAQSEPILVHDQRTNEVYESASFKVEEDRLYGVLELVFRGIYYHHIGRSWREEVKVIPEFLRFTESPNAFDQNEALQTISLNTNLLFLNVAFHGENPPIFQYQLLQPAAPYHAIIRLTFYGGVKIIGFLGRKDA